MTEPTRRQFLHTSAATAAAATFSSGVHAAGSEVIRVGLVGCGARGRGAAEQALAADPHAKLVAIGDAFPDQIDANIEVIGRNAYKHVIDACDVVLLCTPPGFRPIHLQAAVEAGKHVFMEKPVAVDA